MLFKFFVCAKGKQRPSDTVRTSFSVRDGMGSARRGPVVLGSGTGVSLDLGVTPAWRGVICVVLGADVDCPP